MQTCTSAALKALAMLLSSILIFQLAPPVVAFIPVFAMIIYSILPLPVLPTALPILLLSSSASLAMYTTLPRYITVVGATILALTGLYLLDRSLDPDKSKPEVGAKVDGQDAPVSVNYFPSRECNYACGFCFHTNTSGYILPLHEAKRGLRLLKGKDHSFLFLLLLVCPALGRIPAAGG
jgi:hypothetical protein